MRWQSSVAPMRAEQLDMYFVQHLNLGGWFCITNGKTKAQGVQQSQTAAFPDTKRKRKQTKPNNRKSNKRTKRTKISSLFPKRGNRNAKRAETHKNTITQGKA